MSSGLSKYAIKFSLRRKADGGANTPMPKPLNWDYHPSHECPTYTQSMDIGKLLPHEKIESIKKYRLPFKF